MTAFSGYPDTDGINDRNRTRQVRHGSAPTARLYRSRCGHVGSCRWQVHCKTLPLHGVKRTLVAQSQKLTSSVAAWRGRIAGRPYLLLDLSRRRSRLVAPSRPVRLRDRGSTVSQKLTNAHR